MRSKVKMQVITLLCVPVFRFPLLTDRHQLLCNPMALCWLRWGVWPKSAQQLPTLDCTICQWVQITLYMFIECNMLNFFYSSKKGESKLLFFPKWTSSSFDLRCFHPFFKRLFEIAFLFFSAYVVRPQFFYYSVMKILFGMLVSHWFLAVYVLLVVSDISQLGLFQNNAFVWW